MGELLDQVMAGGPPELELDSKQQRVVSCLKEDPSGWAWQLSREQILNPLREAIKESLLSDPSCKLDCAFLCYDTLLDSCASEDDSESWARKLIAWMSPHLTQLHFGPRGWHAAFRHAVVTQAKWLRDHEKLQKAARVDSPGLPPWENKACLVLAELVATDSARKKRRNR
jgi:hypothetical protein